MAAERRFAGRGKTISRSSISFPKTVDAIPGVGSQAGIATQAGLDFAQGRRGEAPRPNFGWNCRRIRQPRHSLV